LSFSSLSSVFFIFRYRAFRQDIIGHSATLKGRRHRLHEQIRPDISSSNTPITFSRVVFSRFSPFQPAFKATVIFWPSSASHCRTVRAAAQRQP